MSHSSGPLNAGTVANFNDGGNTAWSNPTNAQGAQDGTNATASLAVTKTSQRLRCSNYGFAIPSTATIVGIKVEIYDSNPSGDDSDQSCKLLIAGAEAGTDLSAGATMGAAGYKTFGGATTLWGLTPTVAQINAAGFGFSYKAVNGGVATATANVDACRITVFYKDTPEGAATRNEVITIVSAGVRRRVGAATRNEALAIATAGVRRRVGTSSVAEALAIAAAGVRRLVGTATRPETLTIAATGVRRLVSSATLPETLTIAATGVRRLVGDAARGETLAFVAAGVRRRVGTAALPEALTITTTGVRVVAGSAAFACDLDIEADGTRRYSAAAAMTSELDIAAAGTRIVVDSAALTLELTIDAAGNSTRYAAAAMTSELDIAAAGVRRQVSSATLPLAFTYVTAGARRAVGGGSLPLVLDIQTDSEAIQIIRGAVGSGHLAGPARPRLAKQAAGAIDRAVAGEVEAR